MRHNQRKQQQTISEHQHIKQTKHTTHTQQQHIPNAHNKTTQHQDTHNHKHINKITTSNPEKQQ